jgi:hypothetical protein
MKSVLRKLSFQVAAMSIGFAVLVGCMIPSTAVYADGKKNHSEVSSEKKSGTTVALTFTSSDRRIVTDYYSAQVRKGNCPPGLAKKNNGCQPPGQAKKWQRGRPLPSDVTYYDLPRELSVRLPVPPPNHRYVQIAGDILMIAIGTSMVIDAIEDIAR